jgi:flagellar biosynthesis protein FlhG
MADNVDDNNLIAIASGKGGVGKTWFSITLAHALARAGRRILLFDGDIGLANVDVQLGLTVSKDLSAVIHKGAHVKDVIIPYEKGGFDVVAGRSGSASLALLNEDALNRIIDQLYSLTKQYDVILLDLGAGVEQHVRQLAEAAARKIVVITDEPTSLTDAYAFIKICLMSNPSAQFSIVVNQAASQKEGETTWQTLERACKNFLHQSPPLLGVVRKDNKVRDAIRSQTSLLVKAPHTTAATDVAAISAKLLQRKT